MDLNNRPVILGGALAILLVVALFLVAPIYGVLGLAVLLLGALVIANRVRVLGEEQHDDLEETNFDATERLGSLFEDDQPTMLDDRTDSFAGRGVVFEDEVEQYGEDAQPTAEWVSEPAPAAPSADWAPPEEPVTRWTTEDVEPVADERTDYAPPDYATTDDATTDYATTDYATTDYAAAEPLAPVDSEPQTVDWSPDAFEEVPAAPLVERGSIYEVPIETDTPDFAARAAEFERVLEDVSLDDVDASAVLADEGVIDEAKVTDDTAILAASQASSFGAQTMTEEEGSEETKEILGRVAALLAKYE